MIVFEGSEHALTGEPCESGKAHEAELSQEGVGDELADHPLASAELREHAKHVQQIGELVTRSRGREAEQEPGLRDHLGGHVGRVHPRDDSRKHVVITHNGLFELRALLRQHSARSVSAGARWRAASL